MVGSTKTRPAEYYDRHQFLYNWFWSRSALHYGLWSAGVTSLVAAIERTNDAVIETAQVTADDHVFDLGSGTGGTAVRLAQQTGCRVTGMTISPKQHRQARQLSERAGVADRVTFVLGNFEDRLPFPDGSFTVVTAIESFCHAHDKPAVLKEIHRVLRPGGRTIMIDGFLSSRILSQAEQHRYDICRLGWQVPSLWPYDELSELFKTAGFDLVARSDRTADIVPSSNRIRMLGLMTIVPAWLLTALRVAPLLDNARCMIAQRGMFDGVAKYGIVTAVAR